MPDQVVHPDDVVSVTPAPATSQSLDKDAPRRPPPGIAHSMYRGFVSTMQGFDQLIANTMGVIDKVPGVTPGTLGKDAQGEADRRAKELADDENVPQTTGEKLAEGTVRAAGGAVPYLASGPLGAGAIGALQEAHKGKKAAIVGGVKSALFSKVAGALNEELRAVAKTDPVIRNAPKAVQRAVAGATTAGVLASPGDRGPQAIVGGLAGATQGERKSANEVRAARLASATGKTGGDAWSAYKVVGPALEETAKITGKEPKNIEEFQQNVTGTLRRLQDEYRGYLAPILHQPVWGTPVADAIRSAIKNAEVNGVTSETEKIGNKLEARAKEFEKQFTVEQLDNLRELYYENLHGTSKESLQERSSADVRADRIAENAIKDVLYPMADAQAQAAGKPAGYVRGDLKTKQANLIQLKDALLKRGKALNEVEGIRQGTPWYQRGNVTLATHPERGTVVASLHGLMNLMFGDPDSLKEVNKRIASSFPVKRGAPPASRVAAVVAGAKRDQKDSSEPAPASGQGKNTVKMRAPDGSEQDVPVDHVEHYKSKGAVVVQ